MRLRTVKVIGENGEPLIINEDAYDADVHELCEGESIETEEAEDEETEDSEDENEVETKHHGGGRWTVTVNGQAVHEGYLKKAEAHALAAEY